MREEHHELSTAARGQVLVAPRRFPDRERTPGEWTFAPPSTSQSLQQALSAARAPLALHTPPPSIPGGRGSTIHSSQIYYAGATTTKRRGSSPSDRVKTVVLSVRASCTALRSAADMGSRARSSPVSVTSRATCVANRPRAATRRSRYWGTSTRIRSVRLGLFDCTTVRVTSCKACSVVPRGPTNTPSSVGGLALTDSSTVSSSSSLTETSATIFIDTSSPVRNSLAIDPCSASVMPSAMVSSFDGLFSDGVATPPASLGRRLPLLLLSLLLRGVSASTTFGERDFSLRGPA